MCYTEEATKVLDVQCMRTFPCPHANVASAWHSSLCRAEASQASTVHGRRFR